MTRLADLNALEAQFDGPIPAELLRSDADQLVANYREYERLIRHQTEAIRRHDYLAGPTPHREMQQRRAELENDLRTYLDGRVQVLRAMGARSKVALWDEVA